MSTKAPPPPLSLALNKEYSKGLIYNSQFTVWCRIEKKSFAPKLGTRGPIPETGIKKANLLREDATE